jgi:hypothetical protein
MDTFTARKAQAADRHGHHSVHGFCAVCGTAWPCWRGLVEDTGVDAVPVSRSLPPLVALVASGVGTAA